MYANLFFLILILLLVNIAPQIALVAIAPEDVMVVFFEAVGAYLFTLACIALQNRVLQRRIEREKLLLLANVELLAFFCFFYFFLGGASLLNAIARFPETGIVPLMAALGAYFIALALFHLTARPHGHSGPYCIAAQCETARMEMRLLLPFIVPLLLITALKEWMSAYPDNWFKSIETSLTAILPGVVISIGGSVIFLFLMMLFLPALMQWIWQCTPLKKGPLLDRMEALCRKAHFKCAGIKVWGAMGYSVTAAVVGILPRFRYVMFTEGMLSEMKPEWIEAILCHEIGHSYRKHLLIYPFILSGMVVCVTLFSYFFGASIAAFVNFYVGDFPLLWHVAYPLAIFVPYAIIMGLYFRLLFGFFSRLFERQADLHIFALKLDPRNLIAALNCMAEVHGGSPSDPDWHHHSIQERINFIEAASCDPALIFAHHRRVRRMLFLYFIVLIIMSIWVLSIQ